MSDYSPRNEPGAAQLAHTLVVLGLVLAIVLVLSALSDLAGPQALLPLAGRAVSLLPVFA